MKILKKSYTALFITILMLSSCFNLDYEHNIRNFAPRKFCLDVLETEKENQIKIGNGVLTLNKDMTFFITNDSSSYSNISGKWDLCCWGSDYGNYVFKVKGLPEWDSNSPDLYVIVNSKKIHLNFTHCE